MNNQKTTKNLDQLKRREKILKTEIKIINTGILLGAGTSAAHAILALINFCDNAPTEDYIMLTLGAMGFGGLTAICANTAREITKRREQISNQIHSNTMQQK